MSRYDNVLDQPEQFLETPEYQDQQKSTDSLDYHSIEDNEPSLIPKPNEILTSSQHFQSAHDLHDEEKSKLVRSPELYNMDTVSKYDKRSSITNSQLQYRTLSESALTVEDSRHHSNDTSVESSIEYMQQRLPTPFDDVLEKESSPEHSESSQLPLTAFSDTYEPTSSCQRPLAFSTTSNYQRIITDKEYEIVANDLVNQILTDVVMELTNEEDSSMSEKLSTSSSSSSDDEAIPEEDEDEILIQNDPPVRSSFSKVLRRAQTDTKHFDITQSPHTLNPSNARRSSQSDTEFYFRAVSPSVHEYLRMENSSSDEKLSLKTHRLHEKYSGEGEESSGGTERIIQRRKRSNDITTNYESPSVKNVSFKFESNEYLPRQESLDSPVNDFNEKFLTKILQNNILRSNLESSQTDLQLINDNHYEQIYSQTTKKCLTDDDYDGGSETDREELKNNFSSNKIDLNIKNLLDEIIDSISEDSSQSDATTVILNSNKTSLDDEDNRFAILSSSSSSSSSSQSVIYQEEKSSHSFVNNHSYKQSLRFHSKKKFRSYPDSLVSLTSTSFPSGN